MARPPSVAPPIGWPLLPQPDDNGQIDWPTLERSVADSIRILLSTRPGERLMRPRFGAGLQLFLHQSNDLTTRRRIRDLVQESLERWERRIEVLAVDVETVPDRSSEIRVDVSYRIRRTGATARLGATVQLEGS